MRPPSPKQLGASIIAVMALLSVILTLGGALFYKLNMSASSTGRIMSKTRAAYAAESVLRGTVRLAQDCVESLGSTTLGVPPASLSACISASLAAITPDRTRIDHSEVHLIGTPTMGIIPNGP